jgi:3-hydroxy-3-methylglutaryl CoA synthase
MYSMLTSFVFLLIVLFLYLTLYWLFHTPKCKFLKGLCKSLTLAEHFSYAMTQRNRMTLPQHFRKQINASKSFYCLKS